MQTGLVTRLLLGKYVWLLGIGAMVAFILVGVEMGLALLIQQSMQFAFRGQRELLLHSLSLLFTLVLVGALLKYGEKYLLGRYGAMTMHQVRTSLAEKTQYITVKQLESRHSGDWLSRLSNDGFALQNFIVGDLYNYVYQPLIFVAAFSYLLSIDWQLVLICSVIIPLTVLLSINISRPLRGLNLEVQTNLSQYNSLIQETIDGSVTVKSNNMQPYLMGKTGSILQQWLRSVIRMEKRRRWIIPLDIILRVLPFVLCILVGGYRALNQHITSDELLIFIYLINYIVQPSVQIPYLIARFRQTGASVERINELFMEGEERKDGGGLEPGDQLPLVLSHVGFAYEADTPVLEEVSQSFERGKIYAIVGESGSGKSTLFKLLTGMYEYGKGEILLYGQPLSSLSLADIRKQYSVVEQEPYLFPLSIEDNILLARADTEAIDVRRAAHQANAHDFIMQLPEGYQTMLSDGGTTLSGGQRQRIALARAILKNAPVLLLDEAGSALDAESEQKLYEALLTLASGGTTILIIAHRLKVCEIADEVIVMKEGKKLAGGAHSDLLVSCSEYARMYRLQESGAGPVRSASGEGEA
ncbi:ABC transporter ATP-binding protein [Paenibacillus sp. FSL K6-1096]|uniref:ABC transporter ATP-binding protein n=1 Tax=Paenibacillus sp. FSL K6-1096 TaxID=2921460 RepID=UPI0030ECFA52